MKPIAQMPAAVARRVRALFTDIDGTLTTDGRLTAEAYTALWRLHDAGIQVVPVTGRPAGWCDLIAREWPVAGVVGENGALAFYEVGGELRRVFHDGAASEASRARLEAVRDAILAQVPGSRVAKDQPYRMFDLAIDYCEEPPDLGLAGADSIRAVFERFGAHAKVSNIHVNGWFGDYDKLSMVKRFAREVLGADLDADREAFIFCGDSPNDEPMFAFFPNACGVANVAVFAGRMKHLPGWVSSREGAAGFAEIAAVILDRRR
jgi:HAD superfamily hydrolase (TIGR01484 family)